MWIGLGKLLIWSCEGKYSSVLNHIKQAERKWKFTLYHTKYEWFSLTCTKTQISIPLEWAVSPFSNMVILDWWNCFIKVESQHLLKQMATITCSLMRSNGWAVNLLHLHIKMSVWLSILPFPSEGNMRLHFDHLHVNKKSSFMISWNRGITQLIALIWSSAALGISFLT